MVPVLPGSYVLQIHLLLLTSPSSLHLPVLDYLRLGIEHILFGIDHLLFVLALILIVKGKRRLFKTITAFTLAHSITLAAATLGWVHIPPAPVEVRNRAEHYFSCC